MVERTRAHTRLSPRDIPGVRLTLDGLLPRPVELFLPAPLDTASSASLLVHFLGPSFIAVEAASRIDPRLIVASVSSSPGSSAYEQPFRGTDTWPRLLASIDSVLSARLGRKPPLRSIYLSAFSAGNGAVRAILADDAHAARIDGVLILDGIHTSYDPPRRVVAEGGRLDPSSLQALLRYARRAASGNARMIVTHSEVFPGTFASTTETADWLLEQLGLVRRPVLEWGPNGMQQLSVASEGRFTLFGYAGNSAPDHLDQLHAMPWLLAMLLR
jgi:hypothetical protein